MRSNDIRQIPGSPHLPWNPCSSLSLFLPPSSIFDTSSSASTFIWASPTETFGRPLIKKLGANPRPVSKISGLPCFDDNDNIISCRNFKVSLSCPFCSTTVQLHSTLSLSQCMHAISRFQPFASCSTSSPFPL